MPGIDIVDIVIDNQVVISDARVLQNVARVDSDLLFTDATYDIGKAGATRPRDGHFSRNVKVGGTLEQTGDIFFASGSNGVIRRATADGSDNTSIIITGGGASGSNRGGQIDVYGNEHATFPGEVHIEPGSGFLAKVVGGFTVSLTSTLTGNVGVGGASSTGVGLYVQSMALATANQNAIRSDAVFTDAATSSGRAALLRVRTAAAAFTMTAAYGCYIDNASKGAGSTITTAYGQYIAAQDQGGTNWALYTDGATQSRFGGPVTIGGTTIDGAALLDLQSTTRGLLLPRMTTTQRDAITPVNGLVIYNSTNGRIEAYEAGFWVDL